MSKETKKFFKKIHISDIISFDNIFEEDSIKYVREIGSNDFFLQLDITKIR